MRHVVAFLVNHPQLARGDQLDALPGFDRRSLANRERCVFRPLLADGDERRRLGQSVNLRDRPAQFVFESLDGGRGRRRAGGEDADAFGARRRISSGALANEIKTVGAAQSMVTCSFAINSKTARGSTLRRQT